MLNIIYSSTGQLLADVQNDIVYTNMELIDFRREVYEISFSDCKFTTMEKKIDWTLDNILY
ncbi:hypothetical protein [Patiriisocius sp. Uisw_047]|uniref:hypothetical protein n=1 Tax=Patiriisocius sp. Uisw_047 TaxID=3230969 RepID=UPI0039EC692C